MTIRLTNALGASLAFLTWVPASVRGQAQWTEVPLLRSRTEAACAFDRSTGRTIVFGGVLPAGVNPWEFKQDTWRFDTVTSSVQHIAPATSPPARYGHAMAWDGRAIVLFGGRDDTGNVLGDTWLWEDQNMRWSRQTVTPSPAARTGCEMAHDSGRNVVVLFGGIDASGTLLNDTWEWNGFARQWVQVHAGGYSGPSAVAHHAMAYDPSRARTVVYGGRDGVSAASNTVQEWDGGTRTWNYAYGSPGYRVHAAMAFDAVRGELLLYGGSDEQYFTYDDLWSWNGSRWLALAWNEPPGERRSHTLLSVSPTRIDLVGGADGGSGMDVWSYSLGTWTETHAQEVPPATHFSSFTYDQLRGTLIMRYAQSDWTWDGMRWSRFTISPGPPHGTLVHDPVRDRFVSIGWDRVSEWDPHTNTWSTTLTSNTTLLSEHSSLFDPVRGRVFAYGGTTGSTYLDQMWEWDGTNLVRIQAIGAPPRRSASLAYDTRRGKVWMFGGESRQNVFMDETWEFDSATRQWTRHVPPNSPSARAQAVMMYDTHRDRVILLGGATRSSWTADAWEWDPAAPGGGTWTPIQVGTGPNLGRWTIGCYHEPTRRATVFSGAGYGYFEDATWVFESPFPAHSESTGHACAGSAGLPHLENPPWGLPWLGSTMELRLSGVGPNQTWALLLGASERTWNGIGLPLDLGFLGARGCLLTTSIDAAFARVSSSTEDVFTAQLPSDGALLGRTFYQQALLLDPTANVLGITTSQGLRATIGRK